MGRPRPGLVFQLFLRASRVQRKRAILTVASIAWGTLSLLLLLAFGEGLRHALSTSSHGMGENLAICWPGSTSLTWQGLPTGRPVRPRIEDVTLLRQRVTGLEEVAGEIFRGGVVVTNGETTTTATIKGVTNGFGEIRNHIPMAGGRFLNPLDEQMRRRSAFIGDELATTLFGDEEPVGREILLDKTPYTVVGVMKPKMMMGNYEGMDSQQVSIPITTFKAQYGRDRLSTIVLKSARPELMEDVIRQMHEVLGAKYGFDPEDERVFGVWDTVETFQFLVNMLIGIQVFLGIIGGLTLIIGGVGVANIMYAVVKERTKEIGVKMALGARRGWITGPIVLEGLLYTLLGGVVGLLMSVGLIVLLDMIPTEGNEALQMMGTPTLSLEIGAVSALTLGFIGLLAGYFPARRAASINPADTLRYE